VQTILSGHLNHTIVKIFMLSTMAIFETLTDSFNNQFNCTKLASAQFAYDII